MSGLWRFTPEVRTGERGRFLFFSGLFALLTLAQTVGLVGAEALFLARVGVESLPGTFVVAATATVAVSLAYALVVGRVRNDSLFVVLLLGGAVLLAAGAWLSRAGFPGLPSVLFCAWFVTLALFQNHYWTFVDDFFDTLASKRIYPYLTAGGSVGGALGGALAAALPRLGPTELLIAAWAFGLAAVALMLRLGRRRIRRWGPLGFEEADESSAENLRSALRYARRSSMSRWLVASAVGMVSALFVAQYLYSGIFVRRFPDPEQLAAFLGMFLLASNALELLVELRITPWLMRRFGVASANLIHPLLTMLSFAVLAIDFRLAPAILARLNREMLENALAAPVRQLIYNALPVRLRGRMRAFIEGIVVYSGMAVAGSLLWLVPVDIETGGLLLCGLGALLAVLYFAANLATRRAYLGTLVEALEAGRLEFGELGVSLGGFEVSRLSRLWHDLLGHDEARVRRTALELPPLLAEHELFEELLVGRHHYDAPIRSASVRALGSLDDPDAREAVASALSDPEPDVRLAAVRALGGDESDEWAVRLLVPVLDDADAAVRAQAARTLGGAGEELLGRMVRSGDGGQVDAALGRLPAALAPLAAERIDDPDPHIRAAALACLVRLQAAESIPLSALAPALDDASSEVRRAALALAAALPGDDGLERVARALDDSSREVRGDATRLLAGFGERGAAAAERYLDARGVWTVDAALETLAASGAPRGREILAGSLRARVDRAWSHLLAAHAVAAERALMPRFLAAAHGDALSRELRHSFRILELLEDPGVVRRVLRTLRVGSPRSRADALEVLSNLGDRAAAARLALMHESGPLGDRIRGAGELGAGPPLAAEVVARAPRDEDPWVRLAAGGAADDAKERKTMERLLALRQVPLFEHLRLDQLESISRAMQDREYVRGEAICREGEPGSELYLLIEGEAQVYSRHGTPNQQLLTTYTPVGYFGEMAVLDDERRTATIIASKDSHLLSLDGDRLKELITRMPEISFEIFRELIGRVRAAEGRANREGP